MAVVRKNDRKKAGPLRKLYYTARKRGGSRLPIPLYRCILRASRLSCELYLKPGPRNYLLPSTCHQPAYQRQRRLSISTMKKPIPSILTLLAVTGSLMGTHIATAGLILTKPSPSSPQPDVMPQRGRLLTDEMAQEIDLERSVQQRASRGLAPSMEMVDTKRHPKPKRPLGNDIGLARERSLPHNIDHLETTVSIGYTMSNSTAPAIKDEEKREEEAISRQLHDIIESVPTIALPKHPLPNMEFHKDVEEESINQRITEVARQLTESAMRKEYEQGLLKHILPSQSEIFRSLPTEEQTDASPTEEIAETETVEDAESTTMSLEKTEKESPAWPVQSVITGKAAKSLKESQTLPLVSHIPHEVSQLQLIAELQSVPHLLISEGFRTPPELIGPLLGRPSFAGDDIVSQSMPRGARNMATPVPAIPVQAVEPMRLPNFLKIVSPRYKFSSNDLVVSVPVGGTYLPAIVTGKNTWWTDPTYKDIAQKQEQQLFH